MSLACLVYPEIPVPLVNRVTLDFPETLETRASLAIASCIRNAEVNKNRLDLWLRT